MFCSLFLVGAAKSGTRSLYKAFELSESCATPYKKEPNQSNTGLSCVPGNGFGEKHATVVIRDRDAYYANLKNFGGSARLVCDDGSVRIVG